MQISPAPAEELARCLFEESNDAFFIVRPRDKRLLEVNPTAVRLSGFSHAELLHMRLHDLIESDIEGDFERLIDAIDRTGFFHSNEDYRLNRSSGEPIFINLSVSRIHAEPETLALAVVRDVTTRKEAEADLRRAKADLEERVAERTRDLAESIRQLEREGAERRAAESALRDSHRQLEATVAKLSETQAQVIRRERLQALGEMSSGVAHELANTLTPVLSYADLLLARSETLDSRLREYVELLSTSAGDAAAVVARLRKFHEPRSSSSALERTNLRRLVRQIPDLTRPRWYDEALRSGRLIRVEVDAREDVEALCVPSEIREVLTNLVFNSVDAITSDGSIRLRLRSQSDDAVIEVCDTGTGMTREQRERCLEPFFTTKHGQGSGLGLSVCHGIVERHGGRIEIESTLGMGTRFVIRIPRHSAAGTVDAPASESDLPRLRILFIEDDDRVRRALAAFAESIDQEIDTAPNGPAGIELLREGEYDLVITDYSMPKMNGSQVARIVRQMRPGLPVVLLTGWGGAPEGDDGDDGGLERVLRKPVSMSSLTNLIRSVGSHRGD